MSVTAHFNFNVNDEKSLKFAIDAINRLKKEGILTEAMVHTASSRIYKNNQFKSSEEIHWRQEYEKRLNKRFRASADFEQSGLSVVDYIKKMLGEDDETPTSEIQSQNKKGNKKEPIEVY